MSKRPYMVEVDMSLVRKLNGEGLFSVPAWAIKCRWFSGAMTSCLYFVDQGGTDCARIVATEVER